MLFINKLTQPGGIKRVDLQHDMVQVSTRDGNIITYRRVLSDASISKSNGNRDSDKEVAANLGDHWKQESGGVER